jgi:hypothetical protein
MFCLENLPVAESKRPPGANSTHDLVIRKNAILVGVVFKISRRQRQTHLLYTRQRCNNVALTTMCAYQNK